MQIDHLTITNFAGYEHRKFDFKPGFNLLVGANASGKTSILDALSVSVGSWFLGMGGGERPSNIGLGRVRLLAQKHSDLYTFEKQFPCRVEADGIVLGREVQWVRSLEHAYGRTTSQGSRDLVSLAHDADDAVRRESTIMLPLICTFGTGRLRDDVAPRKAKVASGPGRERPSRLDGYEGYARSEIQQTALIEWIKRQSLVSFQLRGETTALGVVKRAICYCLENAEDVYFDAVVDDVIVVMKGDVRQVFANLSDGQRIMLTLVGDLARRAITLNPDLGYSVLEEITGVVTIDELDLHLHPKWQRRVISDLKRTFPKVQFIATTHSPQLIGEAESNEVIILGDMKTETTAQAFGMDSNWVLRHIMGADDRDSGVKFELHQIEKLVNALELDAARLHLSKLRSRIGNHPDLVRFSARVDRFRGSSK